MKSYSLVGQNGNAFNVMGYVAHAMRQCQFDQSEIDDYFEKATSSDYDHLIIVSMEYIDKCNERCGEIEE